MAENSTEGCCGNSSQDSPLAAHDAESALAIIEMLSSSYDAQDSSLDVGSPPEGNGLYRKPRRSSILSRSNSNRPRVKKSVSFCSMPEDRRVSNARDCLAVMQEGTELTKLKPNGRLYRRYFWLEDDMTELRWMPTSKSNNKAKILVDDIKEVQSGANSSCSETKGSGGSSSGTREFDSSAYQEEYRFTVLHGTHYTPLELVTKTPEEASIWIAGLNYLISHKEKLRASASSSQQRSVVSDQDTTLICEGEGQTDEDCRRRNMRDRWLAEVYAEHAGTETDFLAESDAIKAILQTNPAVDVQHINLKLKELYSNTERTCSKGVLCCDDFITLFKDVASRQEIYFLMTRYGSSDAYMNAEDLQSFLETEQAMTDVSKRQCEELIVQYEPSREGRAKLKLGIDGLLAYLLSSSCDIYNQKYNTVIQDMTQPLSHYYINSSHKTYLLEDQLKGPSSAAAYSRALRHGCRYIEVDCWDGADGSPIVFHGRTLTSKVPLSDVLDAIQRHAFQTTPYPLILSIENHCSLEQQKVLADMLKAKLGEWLYTTPINGNSCSLPSPDQLKHRILVKCKKLEDDGVILESGDVSEEDESLDADWRKLPRKESSRRIPMLRDLSDLVNWCQSCSYDKFYFPSGSSSRTPRKQWHVVSLSDLYVQKLIQTSPDDLLSCTRSGLTRVYPNCSRVDSSNFNPQDMWNFGCQIVALNQQSQGVCYDLNAAKFRQNGSCGYVLKPSLLCDSSVTVNPHSMSSQFIPGHTPQLVQIKVISGHRFPKPRGSATRSLITDPYVYIEIFGVQADASTARTKTVAGNGQNPFFDESFTFYIHLPELAMLRFNILDDDFIGDEFIAQYTIPFPCIRTGYRHINLLSSSGERIPGCTLFVHITCTDAFDKKPVKKGPIMSSKLKLVKDPVMIRTVGLKPVDDLTKTALTSLNELTELRYNVELSLAKFKEACDVSAVSNIKYCMKTIASRASNTKGFSMKLVNDSYMPMLVVNDGSAPDILKKALLTYMTWCKECRTLMDHGDSKKAAVLEVEKTLCSQMADMTAYMENFSLSERKINKVNDNLMWNLRVIKDQISLHDHYTMSCRNNFNRVIEAATAAGIEVVSPTD